MDYYVELLDRINPNDETSGVIELNVTNILEEFLEKHKYYIYEKNLTVLDFNTFFKMNGYFDISYKTGSLDQGIYTISGNKHEIIKRIEFLKENPGDYEYHTLFDLDLINDKYSIVKVIYDNKNHKAYFVNIGFRNGDLYFPKEDVIAKLIKLRCVNGVDIVLDNKLDVPLIFDRTTYEDNKELVEQIPFEINFNKQILMFKETNKIKEENNA